MGPDAADNPRMRQSPSENSDLVKIRRENLLRLMANRLYEATMNVAFEGRSQASGEVVTSEADFAVKLGIGRSYLSQIKSGGKQIHDKLARQFEQHLGLGVGELDVAIEGESSTPDAGVGQFLDVASAAWSRLSPLQRVQVQRLLASDQLPDVLGFLHKAKSF